MTIVIAYKCDYLTKQITLIAVLHNKAIINNRPWERVFVHTDWSANRILNLMSTHMGSVKADTAGISIASMQTEEAIQELYEIMNQDQPFEQKAQQALELGEQQLRVDNGHLTRIHPESDYWQAISSTDPPDGEYPAGLSLDLNTTYCRRVVDEDESIALHDAPNQGWADDPAFETHGLHCYHGSPLKIDNETYGTVCFVAKNPREEPFTDDETAFAELIARLLEHELQRKRTEEKIDRLEEFAGVLSHDIRNPLTVAAGRVEIAKDTHDSEHLEKAENALDRINTIISEVLAMARQGQTVEETEEVQLASIADRCWNSVASAEASLTTEQNLTFRAAPDRLDHLFENLFRNAIEHGDESVSIRVGALEDADGFYVEDDGPGIPEEKREAVLEATYTTGDGNLGLGLAIVESIVSAHDWELTITESADHGARFEISEVIIVTTTVE